VSINGDYPEGIRLVTTAYNLAVSLGVYDEGWMFEILLERLLALKNELIEELKTQVRENTEGGLAERSTDSNAQTDGEVQPNADNADNAANTEQFYRMNILTNADWSRFRERFDEAFPKFNGQLRQYHQDLTNSEIRLFILIKIGFNSTEIANALGISPDSVYKSRYRLRKKLGLKEETDLESFVQAF
jgi:DNA-binding CsgD family transcriptional regulator